MRYISGVFLIIFITLGFSAFAEAAVKCPSIAQTLGRGSVGEQVSSLQKFLADYPGMYPEAVVSGYFGSLTESAIQRFQSRFNIASSGSPSTNGYGVLGPRTRAMLNSVCAEMNSSGATVPAAASPTAAPTPDNTEKKGFYAPTLPYFNPNEAQIVINPKMDLKVNGSDGPVSVTIGSEITVSWTLSDHKWWYCGKLRDWSGSLTSPASGSELVTGVSNSKLFKLICYVDNVSYEDEVIVNTVSAPAPSPTLTATSSALKAGVPYDGPFGRIDCTVSLWPSNIYYLEDGPPSVRWQVSSNPSRDWDYYWHETINGVETKTYGGTTVRELANNVSKLETYNHLPLKVRRYADIVIDQNHAPYAAYSELPNSICRTDEIEFEIKESRSASVFYTNFAKLFNAIFPYFDIAGS